MEPLLQARLSPLALPSIPCIPSALAGASNCRQPARTGRAGKIGSYLTTPVEDDVSPPGASKRYATGTRVRDGVLGAQSIRCWLVRPCPFRRAWLAVRRGGRGEGGRVSGAGGRRGGTDRQRGGLPVQPTRPYQHKRSRARLLGAGSGLRPRGSIPGGCGLARSVKLEHAGANLAAHLWPARLARV